MKSMFSSLQENINSFYLLLKKYIHLNFSKPSSSKQESRLKKLLYLQYGSHYSPNLQAHLPSLHAKIHLTGVSRSVRTQFYLNELNLSVWSLIVTQMQAHTLRKKFIQQNFFCYPDKIFCCPNKTFCLTNKICLI